MTARWTIAVLITFLLIFAPMTLGSDSDTRKAFEEIYEYLGIEPSDETLRELANGWSASTDPSSGIDQRQAAFTALLETMIELQDATATYPGGPPASWVSRVDEIKGLARPPQPLNVETSGEPLGRIGSAGNGAVELVLITGSIPSSILTETFIDLAADRFHITTIDLPATDGSAPLALPRRRDYEDRAWLHEVVDGVLNELREREIESPVLVGHDIGAWIALLLADASPSSFRAAVLIEPALPPMLFSRTPSGIQLSDAENRTRRVNGQLPVLLPPGDPESRYQATSTMLSSLAQDGGIAERAARARARLHPTVYSRYLSELATIDRKRIFESLELPTLLVVDLDDESSIGWPMAFIEAGDWQAAILDAPGAPIRTVPFDDVRDPMLDAPLHLLRTIEDYLAGRDLQPLHPNLEQRANQTSKPRVTTTAIGFTEIELDYWAPAARGRDVWGQVVSWDSLWRAGANEPTRISFNRELVIGGVSVPPGTYSVLVHPKENDPWTLVLNEIPWLWSTVGYDPARNALEIAVTPEPTVSPVEVLTWDVYETSTGRGRLSLAWGNRKINAPLEAPDRLQFIEPVQPARLDSLTGWTLLAEDPSDDAANAMIGLHEGTALYVSYECASDLVWFRFDLASPPNEHTIGMNVAIDTDRDLTTGMSWWGANSAATFDRLVTLWVDGDPENGYAGSVGVSSSNAVSATRNMTSLLEGGLELGIDTSGNHLYLGVPVEHLDDDGDLALIATVGTHIAWNDDLIDQGQVSLSVSEIRSRSCQR